MLTVSKGHLDNLMTDCDKQNTDLSLLVEVLSHDIAVEHGADPTIYRGSVEDVLVALAARGIDPSAIRQKLDCSTRTQGQASPQRALDLSNSKLPTDTAIGGTSRDQPL